jgi:hypothetical protein
MELAMFVLLMLIKEEKFRHCFVNYRYVDILSTYATSKNFALCVLAKMSFAFMYRHVNPDQMEKSLALTQAEMSFILKVLFDQALSEDKEREPWRVLSKDGLILSLKGLCSLKNNCVEFIEQGGLDLFQRMLDVSDTEYLKSCLLLMWQFSHSMGTEYKGNIPLAVKVRCLYLEKGSDLLALADNVVLCLLHSLPGGK